MKLTTSPHERETWCGRLPGPTCVDAPVMHTSGLEDVRDMAISPKLLEFVRHRKVFPLSSALSIPPQGGAGLPTRIAIIGNYLPRQCGIATFTTDLCDA